MVIDRKKELIINDAGHNTSPARIEARLTASPLIAHAVCIGDRRPFNVALLVPDPDAARALRPAVVHHQLAGAVEEANARLAESERIRRSALLDTEWPPGCEELTPTLKLRRRVIEAKYAAEIEALYAEVPRNAWPSPNDGVHAALRPPPDGPGSQGLLRRDREPAEVGR